MLAGLGHLGLQVIDSFLGGGCRDVDLKLLVKFCSEARDSNAGLLNLVGTEQVNHQHGTLTERGLLRCLELLDVCRNARNFGFDLIRVREAASDIKSHFLAKGVQAALQGRRLRISLGGVEIDLDAAAGLGGDLRNQLADLLEVGDLIASNQLAQSLKPWLNRDLLRLRQLVHVRLESAQFASGLLDVLYPASHRERD